MQNWQKLLISNIICLIVGLFCGLNLFKEEDIPPVIPPNNTTDLVKDSIYRDSIYIVNDSIVDRIIFIEKEYDEEVTTIMSNSDSLNLRFFTDYLEHYNNK